MHVWIDDHARDGSEQMALDEALLDIARDTGVAVLRLYRWPADSVSFGVHEAAARTWDRERLEAANVPAVRRPTGGRAVWHATADLTYAVTQPVPPGQSIRSIYRTIHEHLASAVEALGVATELAVTPRRTPRLVGGGACFDAAAGGEVLIEGRKAIGSAQLVRGGALLQHGAIARSDPFHCLARFGRRELPVTAGEAYIVLPDASHLARAIADHWLRLGATAAGPSVTDRAVEASAAHHDRYRSSAWTWRR